MVPPPAPRKDEQKPETKESGAARPPAKKSERKTRSSTSVQNSPRKVAKIESPRSDKGPQRSFEQPKPWIPKPLFPMPVLQKLDLSKVDLAKTPVKKSSTTTRNPEEGDDKPNEDKMHEPVDNPNPVDKKKRVAFQKELKQTYVLAKELLMPSTSKAGSPRSKRTDAAKGATKKAGGVEKRLSDITIAKKGRKKTPGRGRTPRLPKKTWFDERTSSESSSDELSIRHRSRRSHRRDKDDDSRSASGRTCSEDTTDSNDARNPPQTGNAPNAKGSQAGGSTSSSATGKRSEDTDDSDL